MLRKGLALLTVLGVSAGQAQYTNILNGRQFSNMWAANADFTLSQMIQRSMWQSTLTRATGRSASAGTTTPGTSGTTRPPAYKYALSRTDFKFQGQPTQQKNCAAMAQKAEDKKQLANACLSLFKGIQDMPEFRKNNLAAGLTVLIGISLQVSQGKEIGDAESEALQRGLNDLLVDSGMLQKLKPAEVQALYETSVMTGGLIAAIAQNGADEHDENITKLAKALAKTVLASFGFKV